VLEHLGHGDTPGECSGGDGRSSKGKGKGKNEKKSRA
jgi:hypothetical protein